MKRGTLRSILHDTAVAAAAALIVTAVLAVILLLAGLLFQNFDFRAALVTIRGGMFVAGALALFVCAGLLLWSRGNDKVRNHAQWVKRFHIFGLLPVMMIFAVMNLAVASVLDYYLYF